MLNQNNMFWLLSGMKLSDVIITYSFVLLGGIAQEGNITLRNLMYSIDIIPALLIQLAFALILLWLMFIAVKGWPKLKLAVFVVLFSALTVVNAVGLSYVIILGE